MFRCFTWIKIRPAQDGYGSIAAKSLSSPRGWVTSSMSAWPCQSDAASVYPSSVRHPGAERRAPSGGGIGICSACLEEAENKSAGPERNIYYTPVLNTESEFVFTIQ